MQRDLAKSEMELHNIQEANASWEVTRKKTRGAASTVTAVSAFRGEAARKMAGAQKSWVKVVPVGQPM